MKKSHRAVKACAEWLAYCLKIGWKYEDLGALEALWWKHRDWHTGKAKVRK